MDRDKEIAAILAGPGDDAAKLKAMAALAAKPFKAKKVEDDEDEEEDEEKAENDKEKEKAEGDKEKEEEAAKGDKDKPAAEHDGFAVLALPEAKGREQLAAELGRKVSAKTMTVTEAKSLLAAAPKAGRLGDAMSGRDKNPGADAAKPGSGKGLSAAVDRMIADKKAS